MRGFPQNTRNGNTNIVYNAELRWPIVRYLNLQPSSEFLQEFQLLGFADIGTAWVGSSPFSDENPLNNESYENGPISVDVHYIRDPIVRSLGYGLRSKLFGYFVRADFAYGYEDGTWLDRSFFLINEFRFLMFTRILPHAALFIANLIYAANYIITKEVIPLHIGAIGMVLIRVASAGIVFFLLHALFIREGIQSKRIFFFSNMWSFRSRYKSDVVF